jgi:hypothetical protein
MRAVDSPRDRIGRRAGARARRTPRTLGSVVLAEGLARPAGSESLLAIMTSWALFAGFGVCFVLSGLADSDLVTGLIGFASFLAGFGAHIIINRIFASGFTGPQVALALGAFTVGVLCFIVGALFDPGFTATDVALGIAGFGALACGFLAYEMLHRLHRREGRGP